ncbi:hypothetical protein H2509_15810 [Stappia sp. F7233]|uniref:Uncharacterized protein n=1 Tax=Stappia albiluteola TaxID=2758565 RepID=A0A839AHI3_9HYPH|nr:hypothetical protein [Stappia albiluteola]MBA5778595.1 hypothetical protein [Stappia albiluteola]
MTTQGENATPVDGLLPEASRALGLGDAFRYFQGRSGRRYLFSEVAVDDLEDYRNAVVVLLPRLRSSGDSRGRWLGEIDRYGARQGKPISAVRLKRMRAYVHLLANAAPERHSVLADLESNKDQA